MKILVPIDGSTYSENSIAFITSRDSLLKAGTEIELLVVLSKITTSSSIALGKDALDAYYVEEAERIFAPQRKYFTAKNIKITTSSSGRLTGNAMGLMDSSALVSEKYLVGDPSEKIVEEAEAFGADLVIMGSRGLNALAGLFLGSVTNSVLAETKLPMLILRNRSVPRKDGIKVGIAVDGSEYSEAAIAYVLKNAPLFGNGAELSLITVVSDYTTTVIPTMTGMALPTLDDDEIKDLQEKEFAETMEPLRPLFEKANIKVNEVCLVGNAGDEIAAYAKNEGLDLMIMGSHGYGRFKSAVMGSTAMRVAAQGDVPILLIRD